MEEKADSLSQVMTEVFVLLSGFYTIMVSTSQFKSMQIIGAKLQYKMNGVMPWSTIH